MLASIRLIALAILTAYAIAGSFLGGNTSEAVIAFAQATAGGAILAMLASTMMPEAYELGGSSVVFSTILGFIIGFLVSSSHL